MRRRPAPRPPRANPGPGAGAEPHVAGGAAAAGELAVHPQAGEGAAAADRRDQPAARQQQVRPPPTRPDPTRPARPPRQLCRFTPGGAQSQTAAGGGVKLWRLLQRLLWEPFPPVLDLCFSHLETQVQKLEAQQRGELENMREEKTRLQVPCTGGSSQVRLVLTGSSPVCAQEPDGGHSGPGAAAQVRQQQQLGAAQAAGPADGVRAHPHPHGHHGNRSVLPSVANPR